MISSGKLLILKKKKKPTNLVVGRRLMAFSCNPLIIEFNKKCSPSNPIEAPLHYFFQARACKNLASDSYYFPQDSTILNNIVDHQPCHSQLVYDYHMWSKLALSKLIKKSDAMKLLMPSMAMETCTCREDKRQPTPFLVPIFPMKSFHHKNKGLFALDGCVGMCPFPLCEN